MPRVLTLTLAIALTIPNAFGQSASKCEAGYQPFGGRCISNRMSDYIACVEASGGGKQDLLDFLQTKTTESAAGAGAAKGSGVVVAAGGSLELSGQREQEIIKLAESKFFPNAMSECGKALPPIASSKAPPEPKRSK